MSNTIISLLSRCFLTFFLLVVGIKDLVGSSLFSTKVSVMALQFFTLLKSTTMRSQLNMTR